MRKARMKRKPLIRAALEAQLEKCQRRIQDIADNAYKIRQMIAQLDAIPQEKENALHSDAGPEIIGGGTTDSNAGEPNVPDPAASSEVLEK